jgi:hypothetical protein
MVGKITSAGVQGAAVMRTRHACLAEDRSMIMVHAVETAPLSDAEYTRVMALARRGGPEDPDEIAPYEDLRDRLDVLTADDDRARIAYRAAAQAVVAQALRCPVSEVSISDDGTGNADWSIVANPTPTPQERLHELLAHATIHGAGYVAEQVRWRYARTPEEVLVTSMVGELREFIANLGPVPGDVRYALAYIKGKSYADAAATIVEHQELAAEAILRDNWLVVERLAAAAQAEGSIAGVELHQTLADVMVRGPEGLVMTVAI